MYVCVCVCVYIYIYMYVCMYVCICIYMYVCVCMCVYIYIYISFSFSALKSSIRNKLHSSISSNKFGSNSNLLTLIIKTRIGAITYSEYLAILKADII